MSAAPTGRWTYSSHGANRSMEPFVEFVRNPESGSFETFVTEHRADGIDYRRTYRGSEMVNEGLFKDGRMHGWLVRHPFTYQGDVVPGGRDCFQNGEPIKVTSRTEEHTYELQSLMRNMYADLCLKRKKTTKQN